MLKYAHKTHKTWCFLHANFLSLRNFTIKICMLKIHCYCGMGGLLVTNNLVTNIFVTNNLVTGQFGNQQFGNQQFGNLTIC